MKNYEIQEQYDEVKTSILEYLALEDGQDFSDRTLVDLFDLYTREIAIREIKAKESELKRLKGAIVKDIINKEHSTSKEITNELASSNVKNNEKWIPIDDNKVSHEWKCDCGNTSEVTPDWYEDNGTPTCECGEDLKYISTQIEV